MATAVGVAVGMIVAVMVGTGVIIGVGVLAGVGAAAGVGVSAGVGVALFCTVTFTAALPRTEPLEEKAVAEIVCDPLVTVAEFQLKLTGGVEAK